MFRIFLLTAVACIPKTSFSTATTAMALSAVDFEVFGLVQGVFFRKFTKKEADRLGIRGWCMNTPQGSVLGHLQGPGEKVEEMMGWLRTKGSPSSEIQKAEFRNQEAISAYSFNEFSIRKDL